MNKEGKVKVSDTMLLNSSTKVCQQNQFVFVRVIRGNNKLIL